MATCVNCVHYPWKPEADPSMPPAVACHPLLRSKQWTVVTAAELHQCPLYQAKTGVEEAVPETVPPIPQQGDQVGGAGSEGAEIKKPPDDGDENPNGTNPPPGQEGQPPDQLQVIGVDMANGSEQTVPTPQRLPDDLDGMKYQAAVKLAAEMNLDTGGKHAEVVARIRAARLAASQ